MYMSYWHAWWNRVTLSRFFGIVKFKYSLYSHIYKPCMPLENAALVYDLLLVFVWHPCDVSSVLVSGGGISSIHSVTCLCLLLYLNWHISPRVEKRGDFLASKGVSRLNYISDANLNCKLTCSIPLLSPASPISQFPSKPVLPFFTSYVLFSLYSFRV